MSTMRDPDVILAAWLDEGPTGLPDVTRRAIVMALPATTQARRGFPVPGRIADMNPRRLSVLAVAAAVALMAGSLLLAGIGHRGIAPPPSQSPSADESPPLSVPPTPASNASLGYAGTGIIAFTRQNASGGDDLYLIDPSGANERLLVPGGCCALISPDGSQLAAALPGGGLLHEGTSLMGINVYPQPGDSATNTIPAIAGLNAAPDAWSKDGSQVAIDVWSDADPAQDGMAIAGDAPTWDFGTWALGPNESHRDIPIAFSPDGTQLLFLREERTEGSASLGPLFLLSVADRTARQLSAPTMTLQTNGLIQAPASWSPDGSSIVFAATDTSSGSGHTGIFSVASGAGSAIRTLVADAGGATSARYSPDGSWIAYDVAGEVGFHDLHLVQPDGRGDRNLTTDFDPGVCCGVWSPDGSALLVPGTASDDNHYDLYVATLAGGIYQVTRHAGVYSGIAWGVSPP
jgi:Tol biopolymer transport system component